jgi:hypothetical protein
MYNNQAAAVMLVTAVTPGNLTDMYHFGLHFRFMQIECVLPQAYHSSDVLRSLASAPRLALGHPGEVALK